MPEQYVDVDLPSPAAPTPTPAPPAPSDGFADDLFAPIDFQAGVFRDQLGDPNEPAPGPTPAPIAPTEEPEPAPAPAPVQPETIEYEDGSALSIERTNKGWRAVLNSGAGNPEVFYGKTKDEMWTNVAAAKMHATRHIRDLDRKIKLTARPTPQSPSPLQPIPQSRQLTADETAEVALHLKSDPGLAFDTYFQKRTGLTVDQLVNLANDGRQARQELEAEGVVRTFRAQHPEYQVIDQNFKSMLGWLSKYKLGRTLNDTNQQEIMSALYDHGLWSADNLNEAFEDLAQDGLLELDLGPSEEEEELPPSPQPVPQAQPPAAGPRIAAPPQRRPRAGLGIHARETVSVPPRDTPRPPSDEELDSLTDAEIAAQFAAVRRLASQTRR